VNVAFQFPQSIEMERPMFDPNAVMIANMRYEEMIHKAQYERLPQWPIQYTPFHQRLLAGVGRLLVAWGTILQNRYGNAGTIAEWTNANRQVERAL
jgi:hypothetical protein